MSRNNLKNTFYCKHSDWTISRNVPSEICHLGANCAKSTCALPHPVRLAAQVNEIRRILRNDQNLMAQLTARVQGNNENARVRLEPINAAGSGPVFISTRATGVQLPPRGDEVFKLWVEYNSSLSTLDELTIALTHDLLQHYKARIPYRVEEVDLGQDLKRLYFVFRPQQYRKYHFFDAFSAAMKSRPADFHFCQQRGLLNKHFEATAANSVGLVPVLDVAGHLCLMLQESISANQKNRKFDPFRGTIRDGENEEWTALHELYEESGMTVQMDVNDLNANVAIWNPAERLYFVPVRLAQVDEQAGSISLKALHKTLGSRFQPNAETIGVWIIPIDVLFGGEFDHDLPRDDENSEVNDLASSFSNIGIGRGPANQQHSHRPFNHGGRGAGSQQRSAVGVTTRSQLSIVESKESNQRWDNRGGRADSAFSWRKHEEAPQPPPNLSERPSNADESKSGFQSCNVSFAPPDEKESISEAKTKPMAEIKEEKWHSGSQHQRGGGKPNNRQLAPAHGSYNRRHNNKSQRRDEI